MCVCVCVSEHACMRGSMSVPVHTEQKGYVPVSGPRNVVRVSVPNPGLACLCPGQACRGVMSTAAGRNSRLRGRGLQVEIFTSLILYCMCIFILIL